jgi:hypothetical protein
MKNTLLQECVIASLEIDGQMIIAKNRDRKYDPKVEIIHELIDGVEVVYWHDTITDWSEGMNEYGIGIVNACLMVKADEAEGKKDEDGKAKGLFLSKDGFIIRASLKSKKLSDAIRDAITYPGKNPKNKGIKGETIVANAKQAFIIEHTSRNLPVIRKVKKGAVAVRTNHGIVYKEEGYTEGKPRESSLSRMEIAKKELKKVTKPSEVLPTLAKQYTKDPFLNPYRRDNPSGMVTTGQIMMNLGKKEVYVRLDDEHSEFEGYKNKLPKGYEPKIKVFYGKENKRLK